MVLPLRSFLNKNGISNQTGDPVKFDIPEQQTYSVVFINAALTDKKMKYVISVPKHTSDKKWFVI